MRWVRLVLCAVTLAQASCGVTVSTSPDVHCTPGYELKSGRCTVREIYFEGGTFTLGRGTCFPYNNAAFHAGQCDLTDEPRETFVGPFYMDATEVVRGEFDASDEDCPALDASCGDTAFWATHPPLSERADTSFKEALAFCEKLGKTLPTEAEWEFAASAGGTRLYPWGDAPPSCELGNLFSEGCDGTDGRSHVVARYPPSPEGVYDLAGNVSEHVAPNPDGYSKGYPSIPVRRSYCEELECAPSHFGARGGASGDFEVYFEAARRATTHEATGFRCVRHP